MQYPERKLVFLKTKKYFFRKVICSPCNHDDGQRYSEPWSEIFQTWSEIFQNHQFDVGIHDVFENGAVAAAFFTISSSPNQANPCISELADLKSDSEINKGTLLSMAPKDGIICNTKGVARVDNTKGLGTMGNADG